MRAPAPTIHTSPEDRPVAIAFDPAFVAEATKVIGLSPTEWDFRLIPKAEFLAAIGYEYARQSKSMLAAVEKWFDTKIDPRRGKQQAKGRRTTVREYFRTTPLETDAPDKSGFRIFDPTIFKRHCLWTSQPAVLRKTVLCGYPLALGPKHWNKPWTSLPAQLRWRICRAMESGVPPVINISVDHPKDKDPELTNRSLSINSPLSEILSQRRDGRFHLLHIDWEMANNENILKAFELFVSIYRPEHTGKQGSRGVEREVLRWLSAWRLSEWASLSPQNQYDRISRYIKISAGNPPRVSASSITMLPNYTEVTGRWRAIKRAKMLCDELQGHQPTEDGNTPFQHVRRVLYRTLEKAREI